MPIFRADGPQLVSLTRVSPGPDLYEKEIEQHLWDNLEAFTGTDLSPVSRQPRVRTGTTTLIPDVVALDAAGRVVIFEVKRSEALAPRFLAFSETIRLVAARPQH